MAAKESTVLSRIKDLMAGREPGWNGDEQPPVIPTIANLSSMERESLRKGDIAPLLNIETRNRF